MRLIPKLISEALEARRVLPEVAQALNDAENEIERLQNEAAGFVRKLETAHSERDSYKALADNLNRQIGGFKEDIERLTRERDEARAAFEDVCGHRDSWRADCEKAQEQARELQVTVVDMSRKLDAANGAKKPAVKKTAKKGAK